MLAAELSQTSCLLLTTGLTWLTDTAQSLCPKRLLLRLLCRQEGQEPLSTEEVAQLKAALPSFLLFATTWSVGASCDKTGRIAFDMFLKSKAAGRLV